MDYQGSIPSRGSDGIFLFTTASIPPPLMLRLRMYGAISPLSSTFSWHGD
jgi:hypothetical protein